MEILRLHLFFAHSNLPRNRLPSSTAETGQLLSWIRDPGGDVDVRRRNPHHWIRGTARQRRRPREPTSNLCRTRQMISSLSQLACQLAETTREVGAHPLRLQRTRPSTRPAQVGQLYSRRLSAWNEETPGMRSERSPRGLAIERPGLQTRAARQQRQSAQPQPDGCQPDHRRNGCRDHLAGSGPSHSSGPRRPAPPPGSPGRSDRTDDFARQVRHREPPHQTSGARDGGSVDRSAGRAGDERTAPPADAS